MENLTNRLFVYPCQGKSTQQWESAVALFVDAVQNVNVIYTDRDAVATSPAFQKRILDLYNIRWYFMVKGSKSYLAERYIRYVKEKLSQAMEIKGTKNWIQFVPAIVKEYNSEKIGNTSYTRASVDAKNFNHFLTQRLKINKNSKFIKQYLPRVKVSDDPTLLFNSSRIYSNFIDSSWNSSIFTFSPGDKVFLARRSDWTKPAVGGAFFKTSHWGSFSSEVYTVSNRQLRATKHFRGYVPVYTLQEFGPDRTFYATELRAAARRQQQQQQQQQQQKGKTIVFKKMLLQLVASFKDQENHVTFEIPEKINVSDFSVKRKYESWVSHKQVFTVSLINITVCNKLAHKNQHFPKPDQYDYEHVDWQD